MLNLKNAKLSDRILFLTWIACGMTVLSFRFGWGTPRMSDLFTWHATYWVTWGVTAWFGYEVIRWLRTRRGWFKENAVALTGLTVICGIIHSSEPHFHKVLADEPSHAALAMSMHLQKVCTIPFIMHFPFEVPNWEHYSAPFRGHYFSFLVSLAHDLTGYRPGNVYWVNGIIGLATLITLYAIGLRITAKRAVSFAIAVAFAATPIFGQVMCSGSYDMTNLLFLMILAYFLIGFASGRLLDQTELRIALLSAALLSYCRPESILYYGVAALVVIAAYRREKTKGRATRMFPEQCFGPLLFIPALCTQIILLSDPATNLAQGHLKPGQAMYSWNYFVNNWTETFAYFMNVTRMDMSHIPLFIMGLSAILLLIIRSLREWRTVEFTELKPIIRTVFFLSAAIFGLYSMVMCSFWGGATNPVMTRFTLPLWFALTLACLLGYTFIHRRYGDTRGNWLPALSLAYFLTATVPTHAKGISIRDNPYAFEYDKALDWVDRTDDRHTLYIGNSSMQFIARNHPAVRMALVSHNIPAYIRLVKSGVIGRLVLIEFRFTDYRDGQAEVHESDWKKNAARWKTKRLWSHPSSIGSEIVAEELIGVTIDGKFHDLTTQDAGLPTGASFLEMQRKVLGMLPYLEEGQPEPR